MFTAEHFSASLVVEAMDISADEIIERLPSEVAIKNKQPPISSNEARRKKSVFLAPLESTVAPDPAALSDPKIGTLPKSAESVIEVDGGAPEGQIMNKNNIYGSFRSLFDAFFNQGRKKAAKDSILTIHQKIR